MTNSSLHKYLNWLKSSYIILFPGFILLLFANGRLAIPPAAWLYPVFLIRFMRRHKPFAGYRIIAVVVATGSVISFWGTASPEPNPLMQLLPVLLGLILALTFLADRLMADSFRGIVSTLVFPLAYTTFDFIFSRFNPMGSTGVLAYSQYYFLPLIQLVAVTGLWGLTFLVAWFGSMVNWVWEKKFQWDQVRNGVLIFSTILFLVLFYGGARLSFAHPSSETVRIAGIHAFDLRKEGAALWQLAQDDREAYRQESRYLQDKLFAASESEARAGARIIVWAEISPVAAAEDQEKFLARASQTAQAEGIYLVVAPYIAQDAPEQKDENKMLIFNPEGNVILTHYKFGGNIIEGTVKGDAVLRTAETEYGTLSGVICWDQDFPHIISQAGRNNTDIMLAPNADWKAITPMHTHMGIFRAIENGYSLVRPNVNGLSVVSDPYGRVLASMDHYTSTEWVMVAQVPTQGVKTIYSIIGDLFGWLSVTAFSVMVLYSLINRKRRGIK